jgi:hypothetical protein
MSSRDVPAAGHTDRFAEEDRGQMSRPQPMKSHSETVGKTPADSARDAARAALGRAGHTVLGAAVDRTVLGVEGVAKRLDRVATGTADTGQRGSAAVRRVADPRPVESRVRRVGSRVGTGVGAGFGLVMRTAIAILRFLQRLALQALAALRDVAQRLRAQIPTKAPSPVEPSMDGAAPAGGAGRSR